MSTNLVRGSLSDIATQSGKSLAESFLSVDAVVIVDTSGSMGARVAPAGKTRYEAALDELAALQAQLPGKIGVISFSSRVEFCPGGIPIFLGESTDIAGALQFARVADVPGMQFFLISDGEPNDEAAALSVARMYQNRINTIYIGPETWPRGRDFLRQLADATGGRQYTAELTKALGSTIKQAMLTAK
jgi:Mg-chelatase subunit ChlD